MSELETSTAGAHCPVVQFAPPDIARRQIATWYGVQTEAVELTRREPFEYGFKAPCHLLVMSELAERATARRALKACRNRRCMTSATS